MSLRRLLLGSLHRLGAGALWRFWHRRAVVILTVHGVADESQPGVWEPLRRRLPAARLDHCLAVLKRHYTFVSLDEAIEMLTGRRPVQPRTMVLTFDDGYKNQLTAVGPILEKHGVPAIVFVATGFVDRRRSFWFDRLDFALQRAVGSLRTFTIGGRQVTIDGRARDSLAAGYAELRTAAKAIRDDARMSAELDGLASDLEREVGEHLDAFVDEDPWSAVLSTEQIRTAPPVLTFGSHTVEHSRIAFLPAPIVEAQLRESQRSLEAWTGRPCRFFCYPDGAWSHEAAALVREVYEAAFSTGRGLNRPGDDLMLLRRIDVPIEGTDAELLAEVSGLLDFLLMMRGVVRGR